MAEPLHSPHWYRIAALRPALRPHLRLVRHEYRGEPWQVIHDPASGRQWRFSAGAERVIALMDGRRTVDQIWALAGEGVRDMPTQDEMLRLLAQLHAADALAVDVAPDLDELLRRHGARRARDLLGRFGNPLALRTRLLAPDAFLARLVPWLRPLLGRGGKLAWWGVLLAGIAVAALHREELGRSLSDLLLAPGSLALALLVYPAIKLVHELAHGCAVKLRGGEVHEIGLMWLLFVPVPYVDASAASAFPDKRARMAVSAAGVRAEAFIAALAMLVWAAVEPGLVRALAYDVTLIAGVSTLLVNGNPLLRYDGYYWLADLLEMPNLAGRASQQLGSVLRRRVLGLEEARRSGDSRAERRWLVAYGLGALVYRGVVLLAIVAVVAAWSKLLALVVGIALLVLQAGVPALRALRGLAADPALQARPARPLLRGAAALATVASVALLPLPLVTFTQGVVWLPEQGEVRAGTDGELRQWLAAPGSMVEAGAPLALLDDPLVDVRLAAAQAELDAAESRYLAARANDAVEAGTMLAQLERARAEWRAASERVDARTVTAPTAGRFVVARPGDAPGRFYRHGDVVGYVVAPGDGTVLAVVDQDEIGLIRERVTQVQVRLADAVADVQQARIVRLAPGGEFELPSAALGRAGGGDVPVSPEDPSGRRSLSRVFRVELGIAQPVERLGGRAWVRIDHGYEALGLRAWRALRRLFLRQFDA